MVGENSPLLSPASSQISEYIPNKIVAYIFLFAAIIFEIVATATLAASDQFTRPLMTFLTVFFYCVTYYLFSWSIKTIPVGLAYGVWSAAGVVFIMIWAAIIWKQVPDLPAVVGSALIIAGVVIANGFSDMEA